MGHLRGASNGSSIYSKASHLFFTACPILSLLTNAIYILNSTRNTTFSIFSLSQMALAEGSSEIIYGACNCGRITISLPRTSLSNFSSLCHCLNCRASSGSLSVISSHSFLYVTLISFQVCGELTHSCQRYQSGRTSQNPQRYCCFGEHFKSSLLW
jgi:hypothetical protein